MGGVSLFVYNQLKQNKMIIKGTFTSVWDGGVEITTNATLDTDDGYVEAESSDTNVTGLNILDMEIFTDENGDEHEICPDCHEYILKTVMVDGVGKTLTEVQRCSNPDCDSNVF